MGGTVYVVRLDYGTFKYYTLVLLLKMQTVSKKDSCAFPGLFFDPTVFLLHVVYRLSSLECLTELPVCVCPVLVSGLLPLLLLDGLRVLRVELGQALVGRKGGRVHGDGSVIGLREKKYIHVYKKPFFN